jgi:hypothetical protein
MRIATSWDFKGQDLKLSTQELKQNDSQYNQNTNIITTDLGPRQGLLQQRGFVREGARLLSQGKAPRRFLCLNSLDVGFACGIAADCLCLLGYCVSGGVKQRIQIKKT